MEFRQYFCGLNCKIWSKIITNLSRLIPLLPLLLQTLVSGSGLVSQGYQILNTLKMKAVKVTYSRLISKGNYENAKIEIELEVEEGEKASEVFEAAKAFVEKRVAVEKLSSYAVEKAQKVMDDKRNHTLAQIEEAEEILSKVKVQDDLPF